MEFFATRNMTPNETQERLNKYVENGVEGYHGVTGSTVASYEVSWWRHKSYKYAGVSRLKPRCTIVTDDVTEFFNYEEYQQLLKTKEQYWRLVWDCHPKSFDKVDILINGERRITDAFYIHEDDQWCTPNDTKINNNVTHWMPAVELPKVPKNMVVDGKPMRTWRDIAESGVYDRSESSPAPEAEPEEESGQPYCIGKGCQDQGCPYYYADTGDEGDE